jgi:mRNA interferase RelE/StbE
VTRQIIFAEPVSLSLSNYLDDPPGLRIMLDAIDGLADDPRPAGSVPWGRELARLHIGRYRVLYQISEDVITIERVDRVTG